MDFQNPQRKAPTSSVDWDLDSKPRSPFTHNSEIKESSRESVSKKDGLNDKQAFSVKIFESVMTVSIAALFFGLPLFFLNLTFQGIAFEKQIYFYFWVLLATISWVTKGIITGEIKIKRTSLDYFIGAFLLAYLISTIFSVDRWHSFFGFFGDPSRGFLSVLACVLAYYFILSNFNKKRLIVALTSIIVSAGIIEFWTVIVLFFSEKLPLWATSHLPASTLGSMSSLGLFLAVMYPLFIVAIYKIVESDKSKVIKNVAAGFVGLFMILSIVLMWLLSPFVFGGDAGTIAILAGTGFFVIFVLSLIVRPAERWSWVVIFGFMAILAILMIGGGEGYLKQRLPVEVSPAYKLSWEVAKNTMKDNFFIGSGAATYGYDFSKYRPQNFNDTQFYNLRFYQGSGLFFEALPTVGFLGTVLLCLIALSYIGTSVYLLAKEKERNKMYSLGILSAAIIFFINAFFGRVDGGILLVGVLITILSLGAIQFESANEGDHLTLSLKASPKYALALAFIFMLVCAGVVYLFVFMSKSLVADMFMRKAVTQSTPSLEGSIATMVKGINLYPNEGRYYTRIGQEFIVLANQEAAKEKDKRNADLIQDYLNKASSLAKQGVDLMPKDVSANESLAQVFENAGMFVDKSIDLTEQYYQQAQSLEPHNPVYFIKLGELKTAKAAASKDDGEKKKLIQEALDFFQKSVDEKRDYAIGYYYISLANETLGNSDQAIDAMQKAIGAERGNMNYIFNLANLLSGRGKGEDYAQAESIYKGIIEKDDAQYNVHLSLGILYERLKKDDAAIAEYKKVLSNLPAGSDDAKSQINKMISNVQNGTGNLKAAAAQPQVQAPAESQPAAPQPVVPTPQVPSANNNPAPIAPNDGLEQVNPPVQPRP
jgi:tetratricopeptide (TPR) repeat protein